MFTKPVSKQPRNKPRALKRRGGISPKPNQSLYTALDSGGHLCGDTARPAGEVANAVEAVKRHAEAWNVAYTCQYEGNDGPKQSLTSAMANVMNLQLVLRPHNYRHRATEVDGDEWQRN